ncbi:hypothetical protein C0J52_07276 [Blattella germanica]|nr:hypothetical protein C0J52_07276 [Blattella germanica]
MARWRALDQTGGTRANTSCPLGRQQTKCVSHYRAINNASKCICLCNVSQAYAWNTGQRTSLQHQST